MPKRCVKCRIVHPVNRFYLRWRDKSIRASVCIKCSLEHGRKYKTKNRGVQSVWRKMMSRCHNKDDKYFYNYGGRGISVCTSWRNKNVFKKWYDKTYIPGRTIERVNNNEGYSPSNCTWATRKEQAANRRITEKFLNNIKKAQAARHAKAITRSKSVTKTCSVCSKRKPRSKFYLDNYSFDKLSNRCAACSREKTRKFRLHKKRSPQ